MAIQRGATAIAEDQYICKKDVNLIFGKQRTELTQVLRKTLHSLPVWKTQNLVVGLSAFKDKSASVTKYAAIIDGEVWVCGIDAPHTQDNY